MIVERDEARREVEEMAHRALMFEVHAKAYWEELQAKKVEREEREKEWKKKMYDASIDVETLRSEFEREREEKEAKLIEMRKKLRKAERVSFQTREVARTAQHQYKGKLEILQRQLHELKEQVASERSTILGGDRFMRREELEEKRDALFVTCLTPKRETAVVLEPPLSPATVEESQSRHGPTLRPKTSPATGQRGGPKKKGERDYMAVLHGAEVGGSADAFGNSVAWQSSPLASPRGRGSKTSRTRSRSRSKAGHTHKQPSCATPRAHTSFTHY